MLFEDKFGNVLMPDELNYLSAWEIESRGIHIYDGEYDDDYYDRSY